MSRMSRSAAIARITDPTLDGLSLERIETPSRSDRVYRQLRERLMRGILKPHQRLRIRELAAALGTSETPVREAIFQLVREGGLELKPHHYIRVRRLSLPERPQPGLGALLHLPLPEIEELLTAGLRHGASPSTSARGSSRR